MVPRSPAGGGAPHVVVGTLLKVRSPVIIGAPHIAVGHSLSVGCDTLVPHVLVIGWGLVVRALVVVVGRA